MNKESIDSNAGPCQIKNGIIKIRLSKLTDNKKDLSKNNYEVSFCETNTLPNLKKLSVPLSPLTPDIYSAYCSTNENNCTSKRSSKKLKKNENNSSQSINCKNDIPFDNKEQLKLENDVNLDFPSKSEKPDATECALEGNMESEFVKDDNETKLFQVKEDNSFTSEMQSAELPPLLINSSLENQSVSPDSKNEISILNSKIMCSIDLSLINRLPLKGSTYNSPNDQIVTIHSDNESVKDNTLKSCIYNTLAENSVGPAMSFELKEEGLSPIKKEKLTPTASDSNNVQLHW